MSLLRRRVHADVHLAVHDAMPIRLIVHTKAYWAGFSSTSTVFKHIFVEHNILENDIDLHNFFDVDQNFFQPHVDFDKHCNIQIDVGNIQLLTDDKHLNINDVSLNINFV